LALDFDPLLSTILKPILVGELQELQ